MEDFEFDIFAENDDAHAGGFDEIMRVLKERVENGELSFEDAANLVIDIVRPGMSDNSHDVRAIFCGAMWAYGCGQLVRRFESVYINTMPWGIGFVIAVERDFRFNRLTQSEQAAIVKSLCVTLQAGGLTASVNDNGQIVITDDDNNTETVMGLEDIVSQFRTELDEKLGPDGPEDQIKRWL